MTTVRTALALAQAHKERAIAGVLSGSGSDGARGVKAIKKMGGTVIVQYQQYQYSRGGYAPFPVEISNPHDRVTDETAAVTLLDPRSPVFREPNEIRPEDWNGWVQERGLYFAHTWDPAYVPLLSMTDPEGPEQKGGLLVAPLGKGHYVYTGLAFFRQLPAGVPGAYKLFANLLAIGK